MKKKILLIILLVIGVLQFFAIDKNNPVVDASLDFVQNSKPPIHISALLKTACYDCHSYETSYPWYTSISPISWWIGNHITKGREVLNYSIWTTYTTDKKSHLLEASIDMVQNGKMPLKSYTYTHPEAKLSDDKKEELIEYFHSIRK